LIRARRQTGTDAGVKSTTLYFDGCRQHVEGNDEGPIDTPKVFYPPRDRYTKKMPDCGRFSVQGSALNLAGQESPSTGWIIFCIDANACKR
jgi:hypothetical protein